MERDSNKPLPGTQTLVVSGHVFQGLQGNNEKFSSRNLKEISNTSVEEAGDMENMGNFVKRHGQVKCVERARQHCVEYRGHFLAGDFHPAPGE